MGSASTLFQFFFKTKEIERNSPLRRFPLSSHLVGLVLIIKPKTGWFHTTVKMKTLTEHVISERRANDYVQWTAATLTTNRNPPSHSHVSNDIIYTPRMSLIKCRSIDHSYIDRYSTNSLLNSFIIYSILINEYWLMLSDVMNSANLRSIRGLLRFNHDLDATNVLIR